MVSKITCVAFDAVGTLIYPEPSVSKVYWQIGSQYGSKYTLDEVQIRFQQTFQDLASGTRNDYSTSEAEEFERWRQIVQRVLSDADDIDRCFEQLHAHFALPCAWRCFPDVAETLHGLTSNGIKILVASNFDARLNALCDQMPELNLVRERVISACIGWHKPSPGFYSELVKLADRSASEILMVGDDLENDVIAARASGLQAVLIDRSGVAENGVITDLRQILGD
ncbi:MAG: dUMP phosphatase [Planctomycetaceae bacterium]|nr:dUMP phosphatase [Planctomycetaceae bacterium]